MKSFSRRIEVDYELAERKIAYSFYGGGTVEAGGLNLIPYWGQNIEGVLTDMCALSKSLGRNIYADFNTVSIIVTPKDELTDLMLRWRYTLKHNHKQIVASVPKENLPVPDSMTIDSLYDLITLAETGVEGVTVTFAGIVDPSQTKLKMSGYVTYGHRALVKHFKNEDGLRSLLRGLAGMRRA